LRSKKRKTNSRLKIINDWANNLYQEKQNHKKNTGSRLIFYAITVPQNERKRANPERWFLDKGTIKQKSTSIDDLKL
jgi:hypothetical protein